MECHSGVFCGTDIEEEEETRSRVLTTQCKNEYRIIQVHPEAIQRDLMTNIS